MADEKWEKFLKSFKENVTDDVVVHASSDHVISGEGLDVLYSNTEDRIESLVVNPCDGFTVRLDYPIIDNKNAVEQIKIISKMVEGILKNINIEDLEKEEIDKSLNEAVEFLENSITPGEIEELMARKEHEQAKKG